MQKLPLSEKEISIRKLALKILVGFFCAAMLSLPVLPQLSVQQCLVSSFICVLAIGLLSRKIGGYKYARSTKSLIEEFKIWEVCREAQEYLGKLTKLRDYVTYDDLVVIDSLIDQNDPSFDFRRRIRGNV